MKHNAGFTDARIGRIERLSKIDLDILKDMAPFMPAFKPRDETPLVEEVRQLLVPPPALNVPESLPVFVEAAEGAPPPHPLPVDRGRWRIAEEPPGTDLSQPWVPDRCVECREPVWTHNAIVAARHETVCESCYYMMVSDYWERQSKQLHQAMTRMVNPFESQA